MLKKLKASIKRRLKFALKSFISQTVITKVERLSPRFLLLEIKSPKFKDIKLNPGDKVKLDIGNFEHRSYTLFSFDSKNGVFNLLCYFRPTSQAQEQLSALQVGDPCEVLGPKDSFNLAAFAAPLCFFGDETTFGLAKALDEYQPGNHFFFEVADSQEARTVLRALSFGDRVTVVEKRQDNVHLADLAQKMQSMDRATFVLVGNAHSIRILRSALLHHGIDNSGIKTKAYWTPVRSAEVD